MLEELRARYHTLRTRLRRLERREVVAVRRWLEYTPNLLHLTILVAVPLLLAGVAWLSNSLETLSFLIFPPLASGTFTLFADPEGKYSSPTKFVGGMTVGALCGVTALRVTGGPGLAPATGVGFAVTPTAAALGIFLTVLATWVLDLEEPTAFSTALLALLLGSNELEFVGGVALSSAVVAGVFYLWRENVYDRRAEYLYQTTRSDDHVLVPMRGDHAQATARFGAEIAAAHEAGKVVLLDIVEDPAHASAEAAAADHRSVSVAGETPDQPGRGEASTDGAPAEAVERIEATADRLETKVGVPCEVVVAAGGPAPGQVALTVADETNCDLVVTPFEERLGSLSPFVRTLFGGTVDVIAFRSTGRTEWRRALVPVRRAGDTAHAMIDFALRVVGGAGHVSVATCIPADDQRRRAEDMLATLVETFSGTIETRVSRLDIQTFLESNEDQYDVLFIGASTDRSTASRFVAPPTFERLRDFHTDVAIVHRG